MRFFFVYSLFLFFSFFSFAKFDVLFVGLLFFPYGHSKTDEVLITTRSIYYIAWRAICDSYHRFYPRPENLFHVM